MYPLFAFTAGLSAALLFSVQPMMAKMVLPIFGGTPSVWNTCMFFFQAFLFLGYVYAHIIATRLPVRRQILVHFILITAAVYFLPFSLSRSMISSALHEEGQVYWLTRILFLTIGVPFLALSASAPLLQKWFSYLSHPSSNDPYFLYASSNFGSLAALLGYPVFIEPTLRLYQQCLGWSIFFGGLILLLAVCSIVTLSHVHHIPPVLMADTMSTGNVGIKRRLRWLLLAFIPSSLMLGATSFITTDIASIPLLWVVPLSLYLATYIMAFSRRKFFSQWILGKIESMAGVILVFTLLTDIKSPLLLIIGLHLFFLFIAALLCHSLLAQDRPGTRYLTQFYISISAGGLLGGMFNAIIAPVVFNQIVEYPLMIVLACLFCRQGIVVTQSALKRLGDFLIPSVLGLATALMAVLIPHFGLEPYQLWMFIIFGIPTILSYFLTKRPLRFGLALAALLTAGTFYCAVKGQTLYTKRNFFGAIRISYNREDQVYQLYHGTTVHGAQFVEAEKRNEPLAYYHRKGPFGEIMQVYNKRAPRDAVAIVGLGVGSMLAYALPGQDWTYYEINPAVVAVAKDGRYFNHLSTSKPASLSIILGDARLRLRGAPQQWYGLIVIDAFSSDAVPTHLLTREALQLYLSKLKPGGIIAFNVSSQNLDLAPVLGDLARDAAIHCIGKNDFDSEELEEDIPGKYSSFWIVMSRDIDSLIPLFGTPGWYKLPGGIDTHPWTDDFSNILSVLRL